MIWFIGTIFLLTIITLVLILVLKGNQKVFNKKTNLYIFVTILVFGLLGLTSFLVRPPGVWKMSTLFGVLIIAFFGLGILHRYMLYRIPNWSNRENIKIESLYSLFVVLIGILSFSTVFWLIGRQGESMDLGFTGNLSSIISLLLMPFFVIKSFDFWKMIPIKEKTVWVLPINNDVPLIEPGRAIILHFSIPIKYSSKETVKFNTRAPIQKTIGEMFHFLLHRHNIERRSFNKIQIAENKSKDKLYGWLFYTTKKRWWGTTKKYINPQTRISTLGLKGGTVVNVKRVIYW